jgi:hypothetical protein
MLALCLMNGRGTAPSTAEIRELVRAGGRIPGEGRLEGSRAGYSGEWQEKRRGMAKLEEREVEKRKSESCCSAAVKKKSARRRNDGEMLSVQVVSRFGARDRRLLS